MMTFLTALKNKLPTARMARMTAAPKHASTFSDRSRQASSKSATPHKGAPDLNTQLVIPVSDDPHEERLRSLHFNQGQFLARQERWEDLAKLVKAEDAARSVTNGGMPISELLCQGARSDVVALAEHLLQDGTPEEARPLQEAISALETILGENNDCHVIVNIVALAHLDIAWAWRGAGAQRNIPARNLEAFDLHCRRALQVLDPFCGIELDSPLVLSTRCALLVGSKDAADRAADDYEDLIDLAPTHQRHIRALGHYMLPQWFGSYENLELEARRTAARTQDVWGAGAYTWTFFDALLVDPHCARVLDVPFFLDGLHDILERCDGQHAANLFAAYTSVSIPNAAKQCGDDLAAAATMAQIQKSAQWIMSNHLHELHPLIWGHAQEGFDNQARIASVDALFKQGRAKADQVFIKLFGDQMRKGNALIFTPQGLYVQQS